MISFFLPAMSILLMIINTPSVVSQCASCPVGWAWANRNFGTCARFPGCVPCPPGTYSRGGRSADQCLPCPYNTYSDSWASGSCQFCPVGKFSSGVGSSSCDKDCPPTQVSIASISGCCTRYASAYNNGTDRDGPSLFYVEDTYPSKLLSKHHFYLNLIPSQEYIFKNWGDVIADGWDPARAYIVSTHFQYFVAFQADGNICKYRGSGPRCRSSEALWCSYPPGVGVGKWEHIQQPDGNLCTLINDNGLALKWCLNGPLASGAYMEIQDDGQFCRKAPNGQTLMCV